MKELIQVFYEPGAVFDYIREKRAWVWALLACLLISAITTVYVVQNIGAENVARTSIENQKSAANLSPEEKENRVQTATKVMGTVVPVSVVIFTAVFFLIIGALYIPIATMGGGQLNFAQALGTVGYAAWPFTVLRALLSALILAITPDKESLDPQRLLAFNLGAFLDKQTTSPPVFALATSFDLLILAQTVFAAWGLAKVARIEFSKSLIGNLLIWVLITLITVGFSFLGPR